MILVDANLLVYAHVSSFPQHENARAWLDGQLNGNTAVGLPWNSVLAFLRIVTNPRVFQKPETMREAWKQVEDWLDCEAAWIPSPRNGIVRCLARSCSAQEYRRTWCPTRILHRWPLSTG